MTIEDINRNYARKYLLLAALIGAGFGVLAYWTVPLLPLLAWEFVVLLGWVVSGALYADAVVKAGLSLDFWPLAVRGAGLGVSSALVYSVVQTIFEILTTREYIPPISISYLLLGTFAGAVASIGWYLIQTKRVSQTG